MNLLIYVLKLHEITSYLNPLFENGIIFVPGCVVRCDPGADSPWCEMGYSHPQGQSHSCGRGLGPLRPKGAGKASSHQRGAIAILSHLHKTGLATWAPLQVRKCRHGKGREQITNNSV